LNIYEFQELIYYNKKYKDSFNNNPFFNRAIKSVVFHKQEIEIEDLLEMLYNISEIMYNEK